MKTRVDRLFEGDPGKLTVGGLSDMCWCQRRDGWVDVRVNVTLEDGSTTVTRVPARMRITRDYCRELGFLTMHVTLDVELLPDHDPESALELVRITEDDYWDIIDPG